MSPSITISDASLSYNGRFLFKNLDLTIKSGKLTCLLGPSGVGKTTLLRMIANIVGSDSIAQGTILCDNQKSLQNQVAYLAQSDSLLPWFNALDNALIGS